MEMFGTWILRRALYFSLQHMSNLTMFVIDKRKEKVNFLSPKTGFKRRKKSMLQEFNHFLPPSLVGKKLGTYT